LAISLGAGESERLLWSEFQQTLDEILSKTSDQTICAALVETYGMVCFIGCQDEKQMQTISTKFAEILDLDIHVADQKPLQTEYQLSLIDNWTFLLTSLPTQFVYDQVVPNYLSKVVQLLKSESVDIRVCAGNLFAFMVGVVRAVEMEEFEMERSLSSYVDIDEALQILSDLSHDTDQKKAKKEKVKQRAPFRDIRQSVLGGGVPSETLEFKHQKFVFSEWHLILQLDRFRAVLAEGLQNHFEMNPLMGQVFGVIVDNGKPKEKMSHLEKRFFMSPSSEKSRTRSKDLTKKRDRRRNETQGWQDD